MAEEDSRRTRLRERSSRPSSWLLDSVLVSGNRSTPPRSRVRAPRGQGDRPRSAVLSRRRGRPAPRTSLGGQIPSAPSPPAGSTRTESLRAALPLLRADVGVVVAHDCVRPLAGADQVEAVIAAVLAGADAAIPAWESPDTLKRLREDGSIEHLGREGILVAQSPMAYRRTTLVEVFERLDEVPLEETIGVELIGGRVVPVTGNRWSQHLVDHRDLRMFERLIGGTDGT